MIDRTIQNIINKARKNRETKMKKFIDWAKQYNKLWIALLGAIVTTLTVYFPSEQWVTMLVTFLTALGVYSVPNIKK